MKKNINILLSKWLFPLNSMFIALTHIHTTNIIPTKENLNQNLKIAKFFTVSVIIIYSFFGGGGDFK